MLPYGLSEHPLSFSFSHAFESYHELHSDFILQELQFTSKSTVSFDAFYASFLGYFDPYSLHDDKISDLFCLHICCGDNVYIAYFPDTLLLNRFF